jgi:RND superfamily putative drug exporter
LFVTWARYVYSRRWGVLVSSALLLAVAVAALIRGGPLGPGMIDGIESERGLDAIERGLGRPESSTFMAIFRSDEWRWPDPRFVDAVRAALAPAAADARVLLVETPADVPEALGARWITADKHSAVAFVTLKKPFRTGGDDYTAVKELVRGGPLTVTLTGYLPFKHDLDRMLQKDLIKAELVSVPLAVIVLLLVFGTVVAALLPVGVGGLAVVGGVAAVMVLAHFTEMAQYTINVVTLIGLGVAIDYSLFIVSRYRDELGRTSCVSDALERTLATAGRAVAFSGIAVGIGLSGLLFYPGSYLSAMGLGGAIVVALAVIAALTFLPALLAVLGPRIAAGRLPFTLDAPPEMGGVWRAVAHAVMARPLAVLVPTLALLLLFGAPFMNLRMAVADVRVLPPGVEARRGFEMLGAELPGLAANRIAIVVTFPSAPALDADRVGALYDLSRRIAALPGVQRVDSLVDLDPRMGRADYQMLFRLPPGLRPAGVRYAERRMVGERAVVLAAVTDGTPESETARNVVRAIRADRRVGDGTLLVTGQTANDLDATDFIVGHTPLAVGFVMAMTYLVLLLAFGSVVIPFKAVLMNLLSISASFGALVWIFQDGHLSGLLDFAPGPLDPTLPVLLFCSVFGLSMDYEVLLLTRMQEEYDRSGDNARAVAEGLERSGRLITSAAAIMVAVFAAFTLARVVVVKAMGLGMAVAVALDATMVRLLIVPATMRLFGSLNWWAPERLRRWLGR